MKKTIILKGILVVFIGFWYFFANSLLTKILFYNAPNNLENRLHLYWNICGAQRNLIDMNIPHLIAFIFMGAIFKLWAFIFAVMGELVQVVIRDREFSWIDIGMNCAGSAIGILIMFLIKRGENNG